MLSIINNYNQLLNLLKTHFQQEVSIWEQMKLMKDSNLLWSLRLMLVTMEEDSLLKRVCLNI